MTSRSLFAHVSASVIAVISSLLGWRRKRKPAPILRFTCLLVACVLLLPASQTKADSYITFKAAGFWTDPYSDIIPLVANVTVNVNSGLISSASFLMNSPGTAYDNFTSIISQGPDSVVPFYDLAIQSTQYNAEFVPPALCTTTNGCHDTLHVVFSNSPSIAARDLTWEIVSGYVNLRDAFCCVYLPEGATLSAVPLPSTLPLFATGLGVLGLLGWRRKRKAT